MCRITIRFRMLILITLVVFPVFGNAPLAERGKLDLRSWNFHRAGTIKLSGEWEFFWNALLTPEDFGASENPAPAYISVPSGWNSQKNKSYKTSGYGTYRLLIQTQPETDVLGIRLYDIFTASRAWFDGKLIYTSGQVGSDKTKSQPGFSYMDIPLFVSDTTTHHELIIQVSNFHHTRSGPIKPVSFGLFSNLAHQSKSMMLVSLFIVGIILVIGLNHLITYALRTKDRSNLYFGLLCLVMILRNISTGDRVITFIFPSLNWELLFKLDNFSGFGTIPLFALFVFLLFPHEFPRKVLYFFVGIGVFISLFVFLTPQSLYGKYRMFYELYILTGGLYLTFGVLARSAYRKREMALLTFIGFFVLYGTAINDVLVSMGVLSTPDVAPFGLVFYMLAQSFILTRGSTIAMAENERLGQALKEEKLLLEERVEQRTLELHQQNDENLKQKRILETQGWFNGNIARLNSVLNSEKINIEQLCRNLLGELLSILGAQVGAIYLAEVKDHETVLVLAGSLNASRETLLKPVILPGEGLVGACFRDQNLCHVKQVSESYVKVTSGLGESNPRSLLLVPLKTHDTIIGVIEIASLRELTEEHTQLMEKTSESIASGLHMLQINASNMQLLTKFHQKEKELFEREEEVHQHLEEMRALQEQIERYRREHVN